MLNNISFLFLTIATTVLTTFTGAKAQGPAYTDCDKKVISYLGWKETPATQWSLQLTAKSGGSLQYIGVSHTDHIADPQFLEMRQIWALQKPTLAFFEGPDRGIADSELETIQKFGEPGFVRFMAKAAGIKTLSLEPSPQEEVNYLIARNDFTPEQIKLFYILREASRLREHKGMDESQIKAAITQLLQKANTLIPAFAKVLPDIESLQPAYEKYWSAPANWWEAPSAWFTPREDGDKTGGKFTNTINRHSSEYRNLHMYRLLTDAVQRGERVFAVVGRNHVPMQAPAIRCALQ
ncbi:hypothetical protein K3G39_14760 [Pontibacter sp. HSC-14F20]|uniref:hypothetical protein n=1 Tax=Pontibacter sp. HSC-14F20 TaxID=2864136 RepID=UPI001C73A2BA|nr:hypothetical protein [Pontibacter sp. HSC-14F20]MBX0334501.1 hypothetical protein [Pontibacter sp. HSC-14F20]